jgi:hypothetical protein
MTCFAKGRHRPCYGRPTVHHILSRQRIKREHASLAAAYRRGEGPRPWSLTQSPEGRGEPALGVLGMPSVRRGRVDPC